MIIDVLRSFCTETLSVQVPSTHGAAKGSLCSEDNWSQKSVSPPFPPLVGLFKCCSSRCIERQPIVSVGYIGVLKIGSIQMRAREMILPKEQSSVSNTHIRSWLLSIRPDPEGLMPSSGLTLAGTHTKVHIHMQAHTQRHMHTQTHTGAHTDAHRQTYSGTHT